MTARVLCLALRRLSGGLLLLACLAAAAVAQDRRVALVIGNAAYRNAPVLANPANDADAMAAALRGLGFVVTVQHDLALAAMRAAVRDFGAQAHGAQVALLFYAGHGLQVGRRDRAENFLVPVDAKLADARDVEDETLALSRVLEWLDGAATRIVLLDACRDNPLAQGMTNAGASRSVSRGLAPIEGATGGTLVAFATEPGTTAADGSGRNSPFTAALLEQLPAAGVEVRTMLTRVRQKVMAATAGRQTPWSNDGLLQEVFLAGRTGAPPDRPPERPREPAAPADREALFWQSAERGGTAADYQAYLAAYPNGSFAALARNRLAAQRSAMVPPPPLPPARPSPQELARQDFAGRWTLADSTVCSATRFGLVTIQGEYIRFEWHAGQGRPNIAFEHIDRAVDNNFYTTVERDENTPTPEIGQRLLYSVSNSSWTSRNLTTGKTGVHVRC